MKNYRSSEKANILLDLLSDPALIVDIKGDFLNVNSAFEEVTGLSRKKLIGIHFSKLNILNAEMKAALSEIQKKRMQGEPNKPYEVCFIGKAGETRCVEVKERKIRYAGQPAYLNVLRDVTDRKKKIDEQIRSSEEKYKSLFENAPDVIVTFDLTGKITSVNKAIMQHGFRENEIVGSDIFKLVPIEYNQKMLTGLKNIAAGNPAQGEIEIVTPNGKRSAEYNSNSIWLNGKVIGCQTIIRDVTERKKTEKALRKSEEEYSSLFANMIDGFAYCQMMFDEAGKPVDFVYLQVNDAFERITGLKRELIIGKKVTEAIPGIKEDNPELFEIYGRVALTGQKEKDVHFQKHLNVWLNVSVYSPAKGYFAAVLEDITERKKAEEALRVSEEKHRKLFEESMDAIFVADAATGIIVDCNPATSKLVGWKKSELVGQHQSVLFSKEQIDRGLSRGFKKHLKDSKKTLETQVMMKTGEIRDVALKATVFELKGKQLMQGTFRDISERKQAERKLKEAQLVLRQECNMLEGVTENVGAGLTIIGKDYSIIWANKVMKQSNSLPVLEDRKCYATYNCLDAVCTECGVKKIFEGKEFDSREYSFFDREKDSTVWIQLIATPIKGKDGNVTAALELALPITERKMMEQSLKSSEEQFRTIMNSALDAILAIDDAGNIVIWNPAASRVFGYAQEEIIGKPISALIPFSLTQTTTQEIRRFVQARPKDSTGSIIETVGIKKDGTEFPAELSFSKMQINGKNHGVGFIRDITQRKKAETSLKSSEEKFRNLAEQSPNIIFINQKGKVVYANTEAEKTTGYTKEEFYSPEFNFMDLIAPESKELVKSQFIKHMKGEDVRPYEYKLISKKGKTMDVINSTKIINYNEETAILGIETDITENKRLKQKLEQYSKHLERLVKERTSQLEQAQAQLVRSERLATIGELAGMVGHDLRNPLSGIKNAAYYLKKKGATCPEDQAKEMLEIIDKAIDHSNKIINDLLDYSREIHLELTESEPCALLNEAMRMIQVPDRIQILNHVLGETWFRVDADKMMRVFINLIKNAIDAMPEKGTLEITSCQRAGKVEIAFADTGVGIPDEVLPKIFSPLFTTKAQGMGFGLAICKRIVESHGGTITVKTAVNKGTTFTITLPIKPKLDVGGEKTWINMPESLLSRTRA